MRNERQTRRQEQCNHADHADQAEFLGEHGEHEIRVRLRKVEKLLHAAAEADAEPLAAADRDQGLRQLEAAVERIGPRIEKRGEALDPIGCQVDEQAEGEHGRADHRGQIAQSRAGHEQHGESGREQHGRGAEIRLEQQQQRGECEQADGLEQPRQRVPEFGALAHAVAADPVEHEHPRQLGNLKIHGADAQPALCSVDRGAETGDLDEHQQAEAEQQQREARLVPDLRRHARDQPRETHAHDPIAELAFEVEEWVGRGARRDRHRGRGDHDQADQQQSGDQAKQEPIPGERHAFTGANAVTHRRGAHAGLPASCLTAAANASPRCA